MSDDVKKQVLHAIADGLTDIEKLDLVVDKIRMGPTLYDLLKKPHIKGGRIWSISVLKDPAVWGTHAVASCDPAFGVDDVTIRVCHLFSTDPCDDCVIQDVMGL
jgi:hypothetical protein